MAGNKKPRRKYRPRSIAQDPIALAMRRVARIPAAEVDQVMAPILASFKAMREGVANEDEWCVLAGSVELGLSIEREGVVRGLHGHLVNAETALQEIAKRARTASAWKPTALYYQEIEHLDTFTWLHRVQLEQLSEGEWRKAHDRAVAQVLSAGGRALELQDLDLQQPLPLAS